MASRVFQNIFLCIYLCLTLAAGTSFANTIDSDHGFSVSIKQNHRQLGVPGKFEPSTEALKELYKHGMYLLGKMGDYSALFNDAKIQKYISDAEITHFAGPMLGDVTSSSAKIWLRTLQPAAVTVKLNNIKLNNNSTSKVFGPVYTTFDDHLVAVVQLNNLRPSTEYDYEIKIDGKEIRLDPNVITVIRTAPEPTISSKSRIAFGADSHIWGLNNQEQADLIRSRDANALLLMGDIVAQDCGWNFGRHRSHYFRRDFFPAWKSLVSTIPVYATWDDHDYLSDDKAGIHRQNDEKKHIQLQEIWKESWVNPSYGFDSSSGHTGGIFFRTRIGPADIIMLDNRWFRDWPKKEPGNGFLGIDQMQWFEEQLLDCKGPFIIVSASSAWNDKVSNGKDSWGKADPEGREKIFQLIEKHNIAGVLLISGDRHGARVLTIPRENGFKFYEFNEGSMGGWTHAPPVAQPNWADVQLYGNKGEFEFGEFSFDASKADEEVTFRSLKNDGNLNFKLTLRRSDLVPDITRPPLHSNKMYQLKGEGVFNPKLSGGNSKPKTSFAEVKMYLLNGKKTRDYHKSKKKIGVLALTSVGDNNFEISGKMEQLPCKVCTLAFTEASMGLKFSKFDYLFDLIYFDPSKFLIRKISSDLNEISGYSIKVYDENQLVVAFGKVESL